MHTELTVRWDASVDERVRKILSAYRRASRDPYVGTPEMLERARRREKFLLDQTLDTLLRTLHRLGPPVIDCSVIDACARLADRVASAPTDFPNS